MKFISETELEGSEVVEVVARALYAHQHAPGADPFTVEWPPKWKPTLVAYWNKALAVVKAQHAYVAKRAAADRSECRGPSPLTVGTAEAEATRNDLSGNLVLDTPQAAGAGCEQGSYPDELTRDQVDYLRR